MAADFDTLWKLLTPDGVKERRLHTLLSVGQGGLVPQKLSTRIPQYPRYKHKSDLQNNLRYFAELLIEDIPITTEIEKQFYYYCYCDTDALSRYALLSQEILAARYASLFPGNEPSPSVEPIDANKDQITITDTVMQEALAKRPIVLLGDVGCGKSSFLKRLMLLTAPKEFEKAIYLHIDLGTRATLEEDLRSYVLRELARQLAAKYGVDVQEENFVRGVYDLDVVKKFRSSIKARIYQKNKQVYEEAIATALVEKTHNRPEHLRRSISHIARARTKQIVIIIDDVDQREIEIQQRAFVIAQEFAKTWEALTFIALRPQTFYASKKSGALSAYPHRVFTIAPPSGANATDGTVRKPAFPPASTRLRGYQMSDSHH
jgi:GTPase SAR1 family protein